MLYDSARGDNGVGGNEVGRIGALIVLGNTDFRNVRVNNEKGLRNVRTEK